MFSFAFLLIASYALFVANVTGSLVDILQTTGNDDESISNDLALLAAIFEEDSTFDKFLNEPAPNLDIEPDLDVAKFRAGISFTTESPIDSYIDQTAVGEWNNYLNQSDGNRILLPDYSKRIGVQIGHFKTTKGSYVDTATLRRTDPTSLTTNPDNSTTLKVTLATKTSQATYDYDLKFLLRTAAGNLTAVPSSNKIVLEIIVAESANGTCVADLHSVVLSQLGRIRLNISDMNPFCNWFFDTFAVDFKSHLYANIKERLSQQLYPQLWKVIKSQNICDHLR